MAQWFPGRWGVEMLGICNSIGCGGDRVGFPGWMRCVVFVVVFTGQGRPRQPTRTRFYACPCCVLLVLVVRVTVWLCHVWCMAGVRVYVPCFVHIYFSGKQDHWGAPGSLWSYELECACVHVCVFILIIGIQVENMVTWAPQAACAIYNLPVHAAQSCVDLMVRSWRVDVGVSGW